MMMQSAMAPIQKILTTRAFAKRRGISERRVRALLLQGRIPDAQRIGRVWAIPASARITRAAGRWGKLKK